jgi:hypothetical protein
LVFCTINSYAAEQSRNPTKNLVEEIKLCHVVLVVLVTTLSETVPMFHAVLYAIKLGTTPRPVQKLEGAVFAMAETMTQETVQ